MKKFLLKTFIFIIFLFIFCIDNVNAQNVILPQPVYTSFQGTNPDYYGTGASSLQSAWNYNGWNNFYGYSVGSLLTIPQNMSWRYEENWCSGKNWQFKGHIFTTSQGASNFFADSVTNVYVVTDKGSSSCSIHFFKTASDGYNSLEFLCSGPPSSTHQIVLEFKTLIPNMRTNFILRQDFFDLTCNITNEQLQQNILNGQKQSEDRIVNSFTNILNVIQHNVLSKIDEKQAETNQKIEDLDETITDSDISGASSSANNFFSDFDDEDYGLSDIITLPLTFINSLGTASCTPLSLPLPFVDTNLTLPCMSEIYEDYFGGFLQIYQIITFGIVGYWVCVNTLRLVNNFKNPDNDEVEVMDL